MDHQIQHLISLYSSYRRELLQHGKLPFRSTSKGFWGVSEIPVLFQLFQKIKLQNYNQFIDLGSGDGRAVLVASLFTHATGIECDEKLYRDSLMLKEEFERSLAASDGATAALQPIRHPASPHVSSEQNRATAWRTASRGSPPSGWLPSVRAQPSQLCWRWRVGRLPQQTTVVPPSVVANNTISETHFLNTDYLMHDLSTYDIAFICPDQPLNRGIENKILKTFNGKLVVYGPHFHPEIMRMVEKYEIEGVIATVYERG
ncbi:hypothetical protein HZB02_02100 [Candidatus Woesearchaeota archaeon]|nr:hypothetical protein [Candidatus Woesearchaeota archaeon]